MLLFYTLSYQYAGAFIASFKSSYAYADHFFARSTVRTSTPEHFSPRLSFRTSTPGIFLFVQPFVRVRQSLFNSFDRSYLYDGHFIARLLVRTSTPEHFSSRLNFRTATPGIFLLVLLFVHVRRTFTAIDCLFLYVYDLIAAKLAGRFDICKCFNRFFYMKIYVL